MSILERPLPRPSDVTRPYWDAAAGHQLVIQQCESCGSKQFYPRILCMQCNSDQLGWLVCSGKGSIYTYTVNHRAPHEYFKSQTPYVVAMVELDEGIRMMANIVGSNSIKASIGARVRVVFEEVGEGVVLPQFELLE